MAKRRGTGVEDVARSMHSFQRLRASRQVHATLMDAAGADLSQQAAQVLVAVTGSPSVAEVARAARMDLGAVSRQLKVLEDDGLLERKPSPDNGSVVIVTLTAAGRRLADRITAVRDNHLAEALSEWTSEDIERLATLMSRLVGDLQATPYPTDTSRTMSGARRTR